MARKLIEVIESRLVLLISFIILTGLFAPSLVFELFVDRTPPVAGFYSAEALNSPVDAGDVLLVRIHRDKVRDDCPVTSSRIAIDQDGVFFDLPDARWVGGESSVGFIEFAYPTTSNMPAGQYRLRVHLSYKCPNVSKPFHYYQPEVAFRIN